MQRPQYRFVGMRRTKSLGGGAAIRRVAHMTLCPPSSIIVFQTSIKPANSKNALTSELIKGESTGGKITMVAYRRGANFFLIISLLVFVSMTALPACRIGQQITDSMQKHGINQTADVSPSIYDWGINGRPNESEAFTVWANVTDDDLDLVNVSVHVNGPNTTIHELMPFNGTLFVTNLDAFHEFGTYDVYVIAIDLANHTTISRHIFVELTVETTNTPDPYITMPIVVITSLVTGAMVCVIAYFYAHRKLESIE